MYKRAFTLIELLVVIAIISLLSSIVLAGLGEARDKARIAKAQEELPGIRNAIFLLQHDTGRGPCGCSLGVDLENPQLKLSDPNSGLFQQPSLDVNGGKCVVTGCTWDQAAIDKWNGKYIDHDDLLDPWGKSYLIDFDFLPFLNRSTDNSGAGYNGTDAQWNCPNAPLEWQSPPNPLPANASQWLAFWRTHAKPVVYSLGPKPYKTGADGAPLSYPAGDCFQEPAPGGNYGDCNTCREVFVPLVK